MDSTFLLPFFTQKLPFVYDQDTVYEICYNHTKRETIYTRHSLVSGNLLFDERLEHERNKEFTMMANANENFEDDEFSRLETFYDRVRIISSFHQYLAALIQNAVS